MGPDLEYGERPPGARLAPFIACIWTLRGEASNDASQRVLPDGHTEIVLNLADPFRRLDGARPGMQPRALFVGQMRRHVHIEPSGRIDLIGIRFRPHGAAALFPFDMGDVADQIEDLSDIAPPSCSPLLERAGNEIGDRVGRVLGELARQPWRAPDPRTGAAVALIRRTGGNAGIEAVARTAGWSLRQLERAFRRDVGLAPKTLARIVRVQAMLRRAEEAKAGGWAALAAACGYADQAHFVREFRAFSGQTPSNFFRNESRLAQFFAGAA